jgi:hypothetical protein
MKSEKNIALIILAVMSILSIMLPLSGCSSSPSFPYQGSYTGNWSGQLTIVGRTIPVGGTISIKVDEKGVGSGNVATSGGSVAPATITAQVDSNGNLTGTVSFMIGGTAFISNWQAKIAASGKSLSMQGTWTSQHGSGTFSGTGTNSK